MKKHISKEIFLQAKAMLDQGKTQAKVAKKLKIGTGTVSKIKNAKTYSAYLGVKVNMSGLDRNFSLDKEIKRLKIEVKKVPAFAKFVENEVALAMTEKLTKATADKQVTIDTQAKRISELTIQADKDLQELVSLRAFGAYVNDFLGKWMTISSNAFKIFRLAVILIVALLAGYVTLAISHIRL